MRDEEKGQDWEKEKLTSNGRIRATSTQQFNVVRRVYQQDRLDKDADYHEPNKPLRQQCKKVAMICGFYNYLHNCVPIAKWLPRYKIREYLLGDLVAGATTAVMHIPQGMAYALLAEVPPIIGLYMAFFPVLIYVIFGTSPHVSMGTFAVACLMAGKVVTAHATMPKDPELNLTTTITSLTEEEVVSGPEYEPLEVLSVLCFTVGVFQLAMWLLRLGAFSTLLSDPLVSGFTTAAAIQVVTSQLKDLFGVVIPKLPNNYKAIYTVIEVGKNLPNLNWVALTMAIVTCTMMMINNEVLKPWVSKRSRVPVPIELLAIVLGTTASTIFNLKKSYGVSQVGHIPTGLPMPKVPPLELIGPIAVEAFTITMVTYTITMSMALIFAAKEKYEIDANQELLALGSSNIFASFFTCAPFCASLSRSYIQYQAGSKTCLASVVSATLILFVLLWIGPVFEKLPRCVLASIIVISLKGMCMQVVELAKFWKLSKLDAIVWLITFLVTLVVNIDIGLMAGLLSSVLSLFYRSQKPYTCLLGNVLDTDLYLDIKRYRAAEELPGIKIFHYCGGLNFASKNLFRSTLFRKIGYMRPSNINLMTDEETAKAYVWDPTLCLRVQCVIIDATALSYVDAQGILTLVDTQKELSASHITVLLAGANCPVLEMINRYNSLEQKEPLQLPTFPTVHDAVVYYNLLEERGQTQVPVLPPS